MLSSDALLAAVTSKRRMPRVGEFDAKKVQVEKKKGTLGLPKADSWIPPFSQFAPLNSPLKVGMPIAWGGVSFDMRSDICGPVRVAPAFDNVAAADARISSPRLRGCGRVPSV